jgi:hypothetical protein
MRVVTPADAGRFGKRYLCMPVFPLDVDWLRFAELTHQLIARVTPMVAPWLSPPMKRTPAFSSTVWSFQIVLALPDTRPSARSMR